MLADAKMSNFKETVIATLTTVHCKSFLLMIYASWKKKKKIVDIIEFDAQSEEALEV